MTQALQRFHSLLFGWIPDISGIPPRRQATLGLVFSVAFHLLLILLLVLFWALKPPAEVTEVKIEMRGLELTLELPEP